MNLTAVVTPSGPLFDVRVQSFAGLNAIGTRLYKLTERQRQEARVELPTLDTVGLTRDEADRVCREWNLFLKVQETIRE